MTTVAAPPTLSQLLNLTTHAENRHLTGAEADRLRTGILRLAGSQYAAQAEHRGDADRLAELEDRIAAVHRLIGRVRAQGGTGVSITHLTTALTGNLENR